MYFSIKKQDIIKPLKRVVSVVERRQTMPILANVLLSIKYNKLSMLGSDSEIEAIAKIALEPRINTDDDGETTVDAHKLFSIINSLSDDKEISFETVGDNLCVKQGRSRFTLGTLPAQDFPYYETSEFSATFDIKQSELSEIIDQTLFCCAVNDVRYYLNGLMLELHANKMTFVSTDGHRLALTERSQDKAYDYASCLAANEVNYTQDIIPRKTLIALKQMLVSDDGSNVSVGINCSEVSFYIGNDLTLNSKLIDGRFPDYYGVLPSLNDKVMIANTSELKQSLSRAMILSNKKYKGVKLSLSANILDVETTNPSKDVAEESIDVEYTGESLVIGFNIKYLLDALSAIKTEKVKIAFGDHLTSALITQPNTDAQKYVVMPMRL